MSHSANKAGLSIVIGDISQLAILIVHCRSMLEPVTIHMNFADTSGNTSQALSLISNREEVPPCGYLSHPIRRHTGASAAQSHAPATNLRIPRYD